MRLSILAVSLFIPILFTGCIGDSNDDGAKGMDVGPTKAFRKWVSTIENNDYGTMWAQLPITAKERFRYAWDDEKEQLAKSPQAVKTKFMKVYGFSSWKELQEEEAAAFFKRSMGRYPTGKLPTKYQLLKKAKVHKITYADEGTSCIVTFLDEDGSPLPMRMKMLREGEEWKVVRLP